MITSTMFPPASTRPPSQFTISTKSGFGPFAVSDLTLLRDNFHISTWLLLGCLIQCVLAFFLRPSLAALPAVLILTFRLLDALLVSLNLKANPWYTGVIHGPVAAAYPIPGQGVTTGKPATNGPGAIMILGARANSALGMFEPGFKEVGDYFTAMIGQLESTPSSGFMGMSTWIGTERTAANETSTISYWRSVDDIHAWSQGPTHSEAWNWWNNGVKAGKFAKVGIMHEIFEVPRENGWEGIYVNYHPTGMLATTRLVEPVEEKGSGAPGGDEWVVPIVEAKRGVYRTSRGRMGRGNETGRENDDVVVDPYASV